MHIVECDLAGRDDEHWSSATHLLFLDVWLSVGVHTWLCLYLCILGALLQQPPSPRVSPKYTEVSPKPGCQSIEAETPPALLLLLATAGRRIENFSSEKWNCRNAAQPRRSSAYRWCTKPLQQNRCSRRCIVLPGLLARPEWDPEKFDQTHSTTYISRHQY